MPDVAAHLSHLYVDADGRPAPVTVMRRKGRVMFKALSEPRKLACATFGLCGLCGLPFAQDEACYTTLDYLDEAVGADEWFTEIPTHGVCLADAFARCPHLHREAPTMFVIGWDRPWTRMRVQRHDHMMGAGDPLSVMVNFEVRATGTTLAEFLASPAATALPAAHGEPLHPVTAALVQDVPAVDLVGACVLHGANDHPGVAYFTALNLANAAKRWNPPSGDGYDGWADLPGGALALAAAGQPIPAPTPAVRPVPRNSPCPCGSGTKTKLCHPDRC